MGAKIAHSLPKLISCLVVTVHETLKITKPYYRLSGQNLDQKVKTVLSVSNVMTTICRHWQKIIFIAYLGKDKTITGAHYVSLLCQLRLQLSEKCTLLNYYNAPRHSSAVVVIRVMNGVGFPLHSKFDSLRRLLLVAQHEKMAGESDFFQTRMYLRCNLAIWNNEQYY